MYANEKSEEKSIAYKVESCFFSFIFLGVSNALSIRIKSDAKRESAAKKTEVFHQ